jgi:ABC-type amino acid transport substrate-binding protein
VKFLGVLKELRRRRVFRVTGLYLVGTWAVLQVADVIAEVVVVPRPVVRLPVAYLVAADNPTVLSAMNNWLAIESANGYIDEIYAYWVEGKTENVRQPRWSIIRDVLGWVD